MMSVPRSNNVVGREMTDPVPKEISPSGLSSKDAPNTALTTSEPEKQESIQTPQPQSQSQSPQPASSQNTPPAQPPSLTLSLFTDYSRLSVARVVAVVGINLVLPFINGIMLGFGEIFAREAVQVGRTWWRQGNLFGLTGSRGVGNVGLSGSRF
jgi:hypothetical protein